MAKKFYGTLRLIPLNNQRALVTTADGDISESATTATEVSYLSGVTSALQSQLDNKQPLDADLTALAALATNGVIARTGAGTVAARTLTAGSTKLSISDGDGVAGNPTLDVVPANIDHDALLNFVANEHIDHSSVSIGTAADSGLAGGGDITATRALAVDITGTTDVGASVAGGDEVLVYDISASALRKTTVTDIVNLANSHPVSHFKATWVNADTATKSITHSLGTTDVMVNIFDIDSGETIMVDTIDRTSTSAISVTASEAPDVGGSGWRVLVLALN